jgi:hypothetical protein
MVNKRQWHASWGWVDYQQVDWKMILEVYCFDTSSVMLLRYFTITLTLVRFKD